ncbi:hypothetical protein SCOCK_490034 [Actinacidiphila cocklensis]|uniref:Uncharacterized protein n=1 Tax=Actinacidiphila cocklensis TaxID=887465 RepID=A0A9W4DVY2_9ACTN|nr:hypothetical protein SCOCK_490034 [Actinacidiphila cocklensis]
MDRFGPWYAVGRSASRGPAQRPQRQPAAQRGERQFGAERHGDRGGEVAARGRGRGVEPGVHHKQRRGRGGCQGVPPVAAGGEEAGGDQAERLQRVEPDPGDRPVRRGRGGRQAGGQHVQPRQQGEPAGDQQPPGPPHAPRRARLLRRFVERDDLGAVEALGTGHFLIAQRQLTHPLPPLVVGCPLHVLQPPACTGAPSVTQGSDPGWRKVHPRTGRQRHGMGMACGFTV